MHDSTKLSCVLPLRLAVVLLTSKGEGLARDRVSETARVMHCMYFNSENKAKLNVACVL